MIFVFSDFARDAVQQFHKFPLIRIGMRHPYGARYWWPSLYHFFEFDGRNIIFSICQRRTADELTRGPATAG